MRGDAGPDSPASVAANATGANATLAKSPETAAGSDVSPAENDDSLFRIAPAELARGDHAGAGAGSRKPSSCPSGWTAGGSAGAASPGTKSTRTVHSPR